MKQHLRTLFLRAGITAGRTQVKLATTIVAQEEMESSKPRDQLTTKEIQVSTRVWEGLS